MTGKEQYWLVNAPAIHCYTFLEKDHWTKHGSLNEVETAEQLAAAFTQCRQERLTLLERVRNQDMVRKVQHSELGSVTLGEQLSEWVAHDLMHAVQVDSVGACPLESDL